MLTASSQLTRPHGHLHWQEKTAAPSFPPNNFRHFLTLFSKFFASFPHGTCSLSVSSEYLALEGYYLPFCAAVPSNTTLWKQFLMAVRIPWTYTGLLPSMARCLNNELLQERGRTSSSRPQFPQVRPGDFRIELSPLHSPLLRGSLLVSFPPLNNMFKFSGSSYLSSALVLARCYIPEGTPRGSVNKDGIT